MLNGCSCLRPFIKEVFFVALVCVVAPKDVLLGMTVHEWLTSLCLEAVYAESFESNFFGSMDRVEKVWDDELVGKIADYTYYSTVLKMDT